MNGAFFNDIVMHGFSRELWSTVFYLWHRVHYFSLKPCQQTLEITLGISELEGCIKHPGIR